MDTKILEDNLQRIIARGKYGTRQVGVDVLKASLEAIKDLKKRIAEIEAIAKRAA